MQPLDSEFAAARPDLLALAYRMLGTVADSEDIVQDAYLRWRQASHGDVRSTTAYLKTIVTRLCIDRLRAMKSAREEYVGPWLPEPLETDTAPSAEDHVELAESVSMAFLRLLENLTPVQRAVFLLHDVFQQSFAEISEIVDSSPANCRQIASRARQFLAERKPRFETSREEHEKLASQFMATCQSGNLDDFLGVLAADVELCSDGGGKVIAARRPIVGADDVARFLHGITKNSGPEYSVQCAWFNRQPALVVKHLEEIDSVFSLSISGGKIAGIYVVRNPDKLRRVTL